MSVTRSISIAISVALLAACAVQRPQVLTPVRVDTARATGTSAPVVTPAATAIGGGWRARTVDTDPLARVDRMEWPAPSGTRSASGAPGPEYWQQRADYGIAVSLDTAQQRVAGSVTIRYTNNSPDTLRFVWLQLDQNLYRAGSKGSMLFPADSRWGVRGFRGGYDIEGLQVNGRAAALHVDDTMGRIDLEQPLAPKGGRLTISDELRVPRSRAWLRSDGPRRHALRDRAVVPAHGRLRRHPRLEHRSVLRPGRVLPRVRRHRLQRHRAGRLYHRRERRAAERRRRAHVRPARATRACGALRLHRRHHHRRRGARHTDPRYAHVALPCAERARRRLGRRARLPVGRRQRQRRARSGLLPDRQGWQGLGAGGRADGVDDPELFGARSTSIPTRRRRRSRGLSAAWSTRCS